MFKHIPYIFSTTAIIGAVVFAVMGEIQIAGYCLILSGLLYFTLSEKVLVTSNEIEKKFPPLKFVSKLVGGSTPRLMKISGVALFIVGLLWMFLV